MRHLSTGFPRLLSPYPVVLLLFACAEAAPGPQPPGDGDWVAYGRDAGGSKYSPLDQITTANVAELELAWSWEP
ncbi:MAG: pyrroloquinoline quinone-dependent dehydrogenase, partial [Gammaproteobacteria bacterium]|nr:pyrroloquinoline quinone-dependent dehydrogenase [Gammaproteobacteria bacterium]